MLMQALMLIQLFHSHVLLLLNLRVEKLLLAQIFMHVDLLKMKRYLMK